MTSFLASEGRRLAGERSCQDGNRDWRVVLAGWEPPAKMCASPPERAQLC